MIYIWRILSLNILQKTTKFWNCLLLQKTGDPIADRYRESVDRPEAFNELGGSLQQVRKFLDAVGAKDEKYSHLEKADIDKVSKCMKEKQEWFDKQMNAQNKLKKYESPAVLASQIRQTKQVSVADEKQNRIKLHCIESEMF